MNRYKDIKVINNDAGKRVYSSIIFPRIEPDENDLYIITSVGDRLDTLAQKYYNNPRYWWIIAIVNEIGSAVVTVPPGTQLRIPSNPSSIIDKYRNANL